MLYNRFFSTQTHKWQQSIKQVTKSNFADEFPNLKTHLSNSDFVAVSLQKTGGCSASWQRVLPFDTADTAYIKAKRAAEKFQALQFAVCPFSVKASKVIAHPFNFHLFPRDELKLGMMPCYTFTCQSAYLDSMVQHGFDFNACVYDGLSYLSREQELSDIVQVEHLTKSSSVGESSLPVHSVADSIFQQGIRSRVKSWIGSCRRASNKRQDALSSSLRKLLSGSELYGSRPCLVIDVISGKQVQLVLEVLKEYVDVVGIPSRGGGVEGVRVVLTSSQEDRDGLLMELQKKEDEQNKRVRGFREVIELISSSQKPVVAHDSLHDFAFIHSKFISKLPLTMDEFRSSLRLVFPQILDVNHLVKEIGPYKKINDVTSTSVYLKRRFSTPVDLEIPHRGEADKVNMHGQDVLKICHLFVNLCSILKLNPEGDHLQFSPSLQGHSNLFNPCLNYGDSAAEDVGIWIGNNRSVSTESLVFFWGLHGGISTGKLKGLLHDIHEFSSENFDIRMVDKSCAVVVFWTPGIAERFRTMMDSENFTSDQLKDEISRGLKATGYETYKRVCELGLWESNLAESFDNVLENTEILSGALLQQEQSAISWNMDDIINLDEL